MLLLIGIAKSAPQFHLPATLCRTMATAHYINGLHGG